MIVPDFWAEARSHYRQGGKQVTVRRFGWSDESQALAEAMAIARAEEALKKILSGYQLRRREPKQAYNGAQGIPIREEVLSRQGDVVITRNGYGARCLNTPDVLFADIDFPVVTLSRFHTAVWLGLLGLAVVMGWAFQSALLGLTLAFSGVVFAKPLASRIDGFMPQPPEGAEVASRSHLQAFLATHPSWNVRLYRTPAGLRVLATHRLFSPLEPEVQDFFRLVGADPVFVRMCLNQNCFRARLTAKPWRMGLAMRMKPRPGVWPVHPDRLGERSAWIAVYEGRAKDFASCRFVEALGSGHIHPKVGTVIELHDAASRALEVSLPLA